LELDLVIVLLIKLELDSNQVVRTFGASLIYLLYIITIHSRKENTSLTFEIDVEFKMIVIYL
jgi:hypothetical protein